MAPTNDLPEGAKAKPNDLLTQTEYGRLKGWSRQYVHQLVRKGRIPVHNGMIDPEEADAVLSQDADPSRDRRVRAESPDFSPEEAEAGRGPFTAASRAYAKARTVREHYAALQEKLDYQRAAGELAIVSDVREAARHAGEVTRATMLTAVDKIGQAIAIEFRIDASRAVAIADFEIQAALNLIARQLDEKLSSYGDVLSRATTDPNDYTT